MSQKSSPMFHLDLSFMWLLRHGILPMVWIALATTPETGRGQSLKFRVLGKPTANKAETARTVNDLMLFQGRLFIGHGDWFKNTGPTDVIAYDFGRKAFDTEHTVDEEAIHRYRRYGDRLFVPGTDSTESWDFGSLYVRDDSAWKKHRTISRGLHVFDFAEFSDRWYVATGSYFGSRKTGPWIGAIYSSEDQAKSWKYEYTTASARGTVSRVTSLMPYRGRLFAFGYRDGPMPREPNSKGAKLGKIQQYNRVAHSVVYDGVGWFPANIISETPLVQTIEPHVFADRLLLVVRSGRYGDQFRNKWHLFAHNGTTTQRLSIECDRIVDTLVKSDRLILLLMREGKHVLAETSDLIKWKNHKLDPHLKKLLSVEYDGKSYYLGQTDGTVLVSTDTAD